MIDVGGRRLSWRRLGSLVAHLPWDSASSRSRFGEQAAWGFTEHLLANAVDALRDANWQRGGDKKIPRPPRIPRPGQQTGRSRLTPNEKAVRLRALHRRAARRR